MQLLKIILGFIRISSVLLERCIFWSLMGTSIAVTFTFAQGSSEAAEYAEAEAYFWTPGDYSGPDADHVQHKLPFVVHLHTVYLDDPIFPAITQYGVCCMGMGALFDIWNANHTYVKATAMWSQRVNSESPLFEYWYAAVFYPATPNTNTVQTPDSSVTTQQDDQNLGVPGISPTIGPVPSDNTCSNVAAGE